MSEPIAGNPMADDLIEAGKTAILNVWASRGLDDPSATDLARAVIDAARISRPSITADASDEFPWAELTSLRYEYARLKARIDQLDNVEF